MFIDATERVGMFKELWGRSSYRGKQITKPRQLKGCSAEDI